MFNNQKKNKITYEKPQRYKSVNDLGLSHQTPSKPVIASALASCFQMSKESSNSKFENAPNHKKKV